MCFHVLIFSSIDNEIVCIVKMFEQDEDETFLMTHIGGHEKCANLS
jgi:hypothetical protein